MEEEAAIMDWSSLPFDLLYTILTWVPLETLHSFRRAMCAEWRRITYEPNFIALHSHRTQSVTGYFLQTINNHAFSSTFVPFLPNSPSSLISLDFLPKGTKILSSTHRGLLCCETPPSHAHRYGVPGRYCICKPASEQWRMIPNPRTKFFTKKVSLVIGTSGSCFKIVRVSAPRRNMWSHSICEIFDSGSWRWRRTEKNMPSLIFLPRPGAEIDGVIYWLVVVDGKDEMIFGFDVGREEGELIPLPEWELEDDEKGSLVSVWKEDKLVVGCEGCLLCLVRVIERRDRAKYIEIWDFCNKKRSWERRYGGRSSLVNLECSDVARDLYTGDVVFAGNAWRAVWYDMKTNKSTRIRVDHQWCSEVFSFSSDFSECNMDFRRN